MNISKLFKNQLDQGGQLAYKKGNIVSLFVSLIFIGSSSSLWPQPLKHGMKTMAVKLAR